MIQAYAVPRAKREFPCLLLHCHWAMINVAKVTTVPKMSSESRTSGDGEAKEIEQDQTTTVSGESGSSVSEGRTSDADVKAEKAVSKENETLETSKPSEEHSVLQSRSSTGY